jgi:hypothetical protein
MPYETQNQNQPDQKKDQFSSQGNIGKVGSDKDESAKRPGGMNDKTGSVSDNKPSQGSTKPSND